MITFAWMCGIAVALIALFSPAACRILARILLAQASAVEAYRSKFRDEFKGVDG